MKLDWKTCLKVGATVFLLYLCMVYWEYAAQLIGSLFGAALPLIVGCAIAYIVNILMSALEMRLFSRFDHPAARKLRRPLSLVMSFALIIGIVILLGRLVVPELKACAELLIAQLPTMVEHVVLWLEGSGLLPDGGLASITQADWETMLEQVIAVFYSGVGHFMDSALVAVTSVFSAIATIAIAVIFSVYLLAGKERLIGQMNRLMIRYFGPVVYEKVHYVLEVVNQCFHKFIVGQCAEAVILGVLCTVGMVLLGIPYAAMTGAVIAFTALIPVAGAYIGAAVGALMIITVSPVKALVFLVFIVVLQQLEGNFIYPKVVGSSLGLPAIWVLAAVIVGGGVLGIAGMLVGVPIAAAAYRLLKEDVRACSQEGK